MNDPTTGPRSHHDHDCRGAHAVDIDCRTAAQLRKTYISVRELDESAIAHSAPRDIPGARARMTDNVAETAVDSGTPGIRARPQTFMTRPVPLRSMRTRSGGEGPFPVHEEREPRPNPALDPAQNRSHDIARRIMIKNGEIEAPEGESSGNAGESLQNAGLSSRKAGKLPQNVGESSRNAGESSQQAACSAIQEVNEEDASGGDSWEPASRGGSWGPASGEDSWESDADTPRVPTQRFRQFQPLPLRNPVSFSTSPIKFGRLPRPWPRQPQVSELTIGLRKMAMELPEHAQTAPICVAPHARSRRSAPSIPRPIIEGDQSPTHSEPIPSPGARERYIYTVGVYKLF